MSWALPLPKDLQRRIWRMKTQSPTATMVAEPLGDLFARGGFVKTVCCNCQCSVVRVVTFNSLHMCEECCAEWFDLFIVARRPEWMWDALWEAYYDLGPDTPLVTILDLANRYLQDSRIFGLHGNHGNPRD
jgi:hypothetical protein